MDGIEFLVDEYRLDSISFLDDELITNKKFVASFCEEMIKRKLHKRIIWECQGRVDQVQSGLLAMLKEASCRLIRFGMESGSDKILRFLKNDTITVQDCYNAVELCNKQRINCFGSFMIGSPDETLDDIMGTVNLIEKSGLNSAACYSLVPYPGTRLYTVCTDENLLKKTISWSDFVVELYASENIPPFVVHNYHFSSDQLYHIARYIDQNVVTRLNFSLSRDRINHRKNLERVIAGEIKLANPVLKVRLCQKKELAEDWIRQKKELAMKIAAHPRPIRFVFTKAASRLGKMRLASSRPPRNDGCKR